MPNDDYDMDKKVEISADEMCRAIAKTMEEEPFDSLIEEDPLMLMTFSMFGRDSRFCSDNKRRNNQCR